MALDPDTPLPDISPDEPCGPSLEFDADFTEFERLCVGKPEQQYGTTVVPAEEPDWKLVAQAGSKLLERTYDLRVFAQMAVARLQREGLEGYAAMLALTRQVLETRWEGVHPQLDPEDDNDPTLRANALLAVASPAQVLRLLRGLPLARSARAGTVTWRDIAIASGAVEVDAEYEKMAEPVIAAAFRDTDAAGLAALRQSLASAIDSTVAIPAAFDAGAGYGTGPDFTELAKLLRDMRQMVERHAVATDVTAVAVEGLPAAPEPAMDGTVAAVAPVRAALSIATLGPVTTRSDALRLLDLVIEYYERNEPSSPLPLLIARARRLADKGFLDLLRDLAPDGVGQAERIAGES